MKPLPNFYSSLHLFLHIMFYISVISCSNSEKSQQDVSSNSESTIEIQSFTAVPSNISLGESSLLLAVFTGQTAVIDNGVGSIVSGTAISVKPQQNTIYTLTVSDSKGNTQTQSVAVTVRTLNAFFYVERPAAAFAVADPRMNVNGDLIAPQFAGNLMLKLPGKPPINITSAYTAKQSDANGNIIKDFGDVQSPSLNFSGNKLVFSMHEGMLAYPGAQQNTWDLWEYEFSDPKDPSANASLHKLFDNNSVSMQSNEFDPVYLPDGRIVYTSDSQSYLKYRFANFGAPNYPYMDENNDGKALNLHIINGNGSVYSIRQLSVNMADERFPAVLADGRIVFSRWRLSREAGKSQFDLYTIYPDGSHLEILYGAHSHGNNAATSMYVKPKPLPDGRLLTILSSSNNYDPNDITTLINSNFGGGDLVFVDYKGYIDNDTPRPSAAQLQTSGQLSASGGAALSGPGLSLGGRYQNFAPDWQNPADFQALVTWLPCQTVTGNPPDYVYATCDNGGNPPLQARYGLFLFHLNSNELETVLIPDSPEVAYADPVIVVNRNEIMINGNNSVPSTLVDKNYPGYNAQLDSEKGVGAIHVRSVYDSDKLLELGLLNNLPNATQLPMTAVGIPDIDRLADPSQTPAATRPVRFVRVISAMPSYDSSIVPNYKYGINNRRMRSILGYASVEPDGSVFVTVPADVPFALELLDKNGEKIGRNASNVYHGDWLKVSSGEIVTCNGCHEGHSQDLPLNSGFTSVNVDGTLSLQTQSSLPPQFTSAIVGGETMAQLLAGLAFQQSPYVETNYVDLKRDIIYKDYWSNTSPGLPNPSIAIEYNDSNFSNSNQGLIYTGKAPIISNFCAPMNFFDPTDQPVWDTSQCMIVIDYERDIQPMWEASRPINSTDMGTCISCHGTVSKTIDPLTMLPLPQVPAGETQLDLTRYAIGPDGITYRFINNDESNRWVSYEEMVHRSIALQVVDVNGSLTLQRVTQDVPDGMGGIITVDVSVTGTLPIALDREARNSRLINVLTGKETTITIDHSQMMTAAEIRVLTEWLDLGAQYYNNSALAIQ